jgi:hypothetical protein
MKFLITTPPKTKSIFVMLPDSLCREQRNNVTFTAWNIPESPTLVNHQFKKKHYFLVFFVTQLKRGLKGHPEIFVNSLKQPLSAHFKGS